MIDNLLLTVSQLTPVFVAIAPKCSGGNLAPSLGGTKKFFAEQDDDFFWQNFHFTGKNFWWPSFFSHRPGFSNFQWFSGSLLS